MNKQQSIILGSDPELFMKGHGGIYIPATGLIPGTKDNPVPIKHGMMQADGCALEFNIIPADNEEDFVRNHLLVMDELHDVVKQHGLEIDVSPSAIFEMDMLAGNPELLKAGCSPDYDAWSVTVNVPPEYDGGMRAAGGHVHISFPEANDDPMNRVHLIRALDFYLGVPSVLIDKDTRRRRLYGKAGAHRPKFKEMGDAYDGVEYRTLSNFWLKKPEYMAWVFRNVKKAHSRFLNLQGTIASMQGQIVSIINNGDVESAQEFCSHFGLEVVQ